MPDIRPESAPSGVPPDVRPDVPSGTSSSAPVGAGTVEEVVRAQLATALGGRRGMLEAAVPTLMFTLIFLVTHLLPVAVGISVATAVVLLVVRTVQHSTVQFVLNSLFGIGLGAFFAWIAARGGGSADDQALAYFVPGLVYNAGYSALMLASIAVRWPLVGFMVGSVAGDPTEWHRDPQVVTLCRNLTWTLLLPCLIRLAVQLPIWLAGHAADDPGPMIAVLGVSKVVMGWPLQVAGLSAMAWLLGRNSTPVQAPATGPA